MIELNRGMGIDEMEFRICSRRRDASGLHLTINVEQTNTSNFMIAE